MSVFHCRWFAVTDLSLIFFRLRSATMGQIYQEHRDSDGFLYIAYSGESTFGWNPVNFFEPFGEGFVLHPLVYIVKPSCLPCVNTAQIAVLSCAINDQSVAMESLLWYSTVLHPLLKAAVAVLKFILHVDGCQVY